MGIFDRIILSIYTLLLSFLSFGVILISLRIISLDYIWTSFSYIHGQWEAALVGGVFFLVSVRLLLASLRSRGSKDTIIQHTDMGEVHIALSAVENLIEKAARHCKGVRGAKIHVTHNKEGLKVNIKVVISPENNVPSVSAEIQRKVQEYIKNTVGVELAEITVLVDNISNDFKTKHRVE